MLSCQTVRTLHTILGSNLSCPIMGTGIRIVPDGNVGTGFRQALGNSQTDSSTGTTDNSCLALQGEHGQQTGVLRSNSVVVDKESIAIDGSGSHGVQGEV